MTGNLESIRRTYYPNDLFLGNLKLWDCREDTGTSCLATQEGHELGVTCLDFSPKGKKDYM